MILSTKKELKYISAYHRIEKIRKMLEMSNPKDIVMTRFISKTKPLYLNRTSHGEKFCSLNIYLGVYPTYNIDPLLQQDFVDIDIDELMESEDENTTEDTNT